MRISRGAGESLALFGCADCRVFKEQRAPTGVTEFIYNFIRGDVP